ncbi:MAG: alcohol dehydrogenase catalytic domain-containing protein, partial [Desulfobulbaceae bacterium]|nr:alcohol dehydrogenase catalytic domain-containing protein [Desulfobulbaceae bacterium]
CGGCDFCLSGVVSHCRSRQVLGIRGKDGCFADYLTLPVANLHTVPESISDEEAVFVEPLAAAYAVLEHLPFATKGEALVLGDGKLGVLVAQVLQSVGVPTTLMGRHQEKLAQASKLGINTILSGQHGEYKKFGFVVEATGTSDGLGEALDLVKPRGLIVLKSTVAGGVAVDLTSVVVDEVTIAGSRCGPFAPALAALAGKRIAVLSFIDSVFPAAEPATAFVKAQTPGTLKVLLDFRCT